MGKKTRLKPRRAQLPRGSHISEITDIDHIDVYLCGLSCTRYINPDDLLVAFWTDWPKPVKWLFSLRNALVKPFGLKGTDGRPEDFEAMIRRGGSSDMSSIWHISGNETVMQLHDKHLDAYISIFADRTGGREYSVYTITTVRYNKRLGWLYFNTIRPFHHIIVRTMMKRILAGYCQG